MNTKVVYDTTEKEDITQVLTTILNQTLYHTQQRQQIAMALIADKFRDMVENDKSMLEVTSEMGTLYIHYDDSGEIEMKFVPNLKFKKMITNSLKGKTTLQKMITEKFKYTIGKVYKDIL